MLSESKIGWIKFENGLEVPTLDGRFYCSRRDPLKEAQIWIQAHSALLDDSQKPVLILGLGAGFHLKTFAQRTNIIVLELQNEWIAHFQKQNPNSTLEFVSDVQAFDGAVLEFRPAWAGQEKTYFTFSQRLRGATASALAEQAERKDLWMLAEALKKSNFDGNLEITVKDIANLFPLENQTAEARLWRTLRELVA